MQVTYSQDISFDIIGDIHGHAQELKQLFATLGYARTPQGYWEHPTKKVIFLGDFIDRGPHQREVLDIVMGMVQNESALAVMGNHEFNALGFHTAHPQNRKTWLRERSNSKIKQHCAFLQEYLGGENKKTLEKVLNFFWELPLWLEITTPQGQFRAIHACWDQKSMEAIAPILDKNSRFKGHRTENGFMRANTKKTQENNAIEILLKGPELSLPSGSYFCDKDGTKRYTVRVKWWECEQQVLGDILMEPGANFEGEHPNTTPLSRVASLENIPRYGKDEVPLFVGHYWQQGDFELFTPNIACLDYSVAKNGKLISYCWSGEKELSIQNSTEIKVAKR